MHGGRVNIGRSCTCCTSGQDGVLAAEAARGSGFARGLVGPVEVLGGGGGLGVFVDGGLPADGERNPFR
jgi:hypothetical protein